MNRHQIESMTDYVSLLRSKKGEAEALFKEMLIGVTVFFRAPEAFEILSNEIVPKLLESKQTDGPIPVWVPGCATGQEAYSLAMVLHKCIERSEHHRVAGHGWHTSQKALPLAGGHT